MGEALLGALVGGGAAVIASAITGAVILKQASKNKDAATEAERVRSFRQLRAARVEGLRALHELERLQANRMAAGGETPTVVDVPVASADR